MNERVSLFKAIIKKRCIVVAVSCKVQGRYDMVHRLNMLGIREARRLRR